MDGNRPIDRTWGLTMNLYLPLDCQPRLHFRYDKQSGTKQSKDKQIKTEQNRTEQNKTELCKLVEWIAKEKKKKQNLHYLLVPTDCSDTAGKQTEEIK